MTPEEAKANHPSRTGSPVESLLNLVAVTDMGVQQMYDPETEEYTPAYVVMFEIEHNGMFYGCTLASAPDAFRGEGGEEVYRVHLELGKRAALEKAGLL